MRTLSSLVIGIIFVVGCHPGIQIHKNPRDCDTGIRYYRPKPYLLITAGPVSSDTKSAEHQPSEVGHSGPSNPHENKLTMQLQYLPDFSEEYSINFRPGLMGTAEVSVSLDDGWNLKAINQKSDNKVPETISALGSLAQSVVHTSQAAISPCPATASVDIPLGYYESVISRGPDGRKRLYGWRYVGFMPFRFASSRFSAKHDL
jgi:hypothetical protein